ncbi:LysM peptidoglycan-binding domain-containing protein [Haloferula sp. BvORR071]|uniref:LysM peptidoglycan-binding domain-containing protein n=1 Tax=Haloferula sp. BvORR071 TaxID=1396141 RepID=UPI000695E450|nr:LysM peptidoglycan-binding domain-containing protein [Haloferula sp. BvORR071]
MTATRYLTLAALAIALPSCSAFKKKDPNYDTAGGGDGNYDTANPYGVPDGGSGESVPYQPVNPPANSNSNPTYSPAAYEENTAQASPTPAPSHSAAPTHATRPASGASVTYTVVKGDTLGGIARRHGVTSAAIKQANGMTSDTVVLGKKLTIPGGSASASAAAAPAAAHAAPSTHTTRSAPAATTSGKTHTVVKGDSLGKIARQHNVSVDALKKANHLTNDTVVLGAKLRIP